MYTLQNSYLQVIVKKTGAELASIKSKITDTEYIWQANPEIWNNHAPNLFPIIGALKNGYYTYENKKYSLPKHGFIRYNEAIILKKQTNTTLVFSLLFSKKTLAQYPFKFEYEITYELIDKTVHIKHNVINLDNKSIFFSLGGHPAFNCPINNNETYSDYYLEFDQIESVNTHLLNKSGLITNQQKPILQQQNILHLHPDIFLDDALIFTTLNSKKIALKSNKIGTILNLHFNDFPYIGLWAKPNVPYVCIEPWLGIADFEDTDQNLQTKHGIITLPENQNYTATYSIEIA